MFEKLKEMILKLFVKEKVKEKIEDLRENNSSNILDGNKEYSKNRESNDYDKEELLKTLNNISLSEKEFIESKYENLEKFIDVYIEDMEKYKEIQVKEYKGNAEIIGINEYINHEMDVHAYNIDKTGHVYYDEDYVEFLAIADEIKNDNMKESLAELNKSKSNISIKDKVDNVKEKVNESNTKESDNNKMNKDIDMDL